MKNPNIGFMFVSLDKDHYYPGSIVKGSVFFQLYTNELHQKRLMIKFEGCELVPKKLEKQFYYAENMLNNSSDEEKDNLQIHYGNEEAI